MDKIKKEDDIKALEKLKEEIKEVLERKPKDIEEFAKISDDGKSLLIRIPAEIKKDFNVKKGDYFRFFAEIKDEKIGDLIITIVKKE